MTSSTGGGCKLERLTLHLLDRLEPGHGRTPLHVACEISNLTRIPELLEADFDLLFVQGGKGLLAVAYLESAERLEMEKDVRQSVNDKTIEEARNIEKLFLRSDFPTPAGHVRLVR